MPEAQFTPQENEYITFIQRKDDCNRTDAEQTYMKYLHQSLPVRRRIRDKIIDFVIQESKERKLKMEMEQQTIESPRYKQTEEKIPPKVKKAKNQYIALRFEKLKGTNKRHWDYEKGENISYRESLYRRNAYLKSQGLPYNAKWIRKGD